ncbi:BRCT domain-containing protein [Undibacterium sp. Ji22W]|uniref:BRCT domain-containing protein n=1 Tax=Undibacterium sp. Ji22W TaxID=3413038 RepID=UPI003BF2577C
MSNEHAIAAANNVRNLAKSAQTLLGICSGIAADGQVNETEILFLREWLAEHEEIAVVWPGSVIAKRIQEIIADNVVTLEEREDLLQTLQEVAGNFFGETGVAQQNSPTLPIDLNPVLEFAGKTVCFTGSFLLGTRTACEKTIEKHGGVPASSITKRLDYLIIGTLASPDWVNTTYGRKIEKAVAYREEQGRPAIISEYQWTNALGLA